MKIDLQNLPKESSFLSIDKDLSIIIDKFLQDNRLNKLLFYTTSDALSREALTEEQKITLINKNIRIVPKLDISGEILNYIIISFDNFSQSDNPEFKNNIISFDIICHFDQWILKDSQLRPYKIASEIDTIINNIRLTGIGKAEFIGASQLILNEEFAGISLMYQVYHGGEDKFNPLNPEEKEELELNFDELFNNV